MEITIRSVCPEDAPAIHEIRTMPGVMENILGTPCERLAATQAFLSGLDSNAVQFAAVAHLPDGSERTVGICGLDVYPQARMRHSASLGIMVHKDYQSMGVGTKLVQAVLDAADNWLMLVRVELTVFTDNTKAISLYEKMGFVKEGVKKKGSIRAGAYEDEYYMARIRHAD